MLSISCAGGTFSKQMAPSIPVKRLYPTDAKDDKETTSDVIFFHGLKIDPGTDYEKTWRNKDNISWPKKWLPKDLKKIGFSLFPMMQRLQNGLPEVILRMSSPLAKFFSRML
jgi:hypothetical protein